MVHPDKGGRTSRRTLLKAAGTAGVVGLSGCLGQLGGGSGVNEVRVGVLQPTSAFQSNVAKDNVRAVRLAASQAEETTSLETVEVIHRDPQAKPDVGVQKAQELVNDENVDILFGNILGPVAIAVSQFANQNEIMYFSQLVDDTAYKKVCSEFTFPIIASVPAYSETSTGHALKHGFGKTVYVLHGNYSAMQSIKRWHQQQTITKHGGEFVGSSVLPLGSTDFAQQVTSAKESGADIVHFADGGARVVQALNQATNFGFVDEGITMTAPIVTMPDVRGMDEALRAYDRAFFSTLWYHEHDAPDSQQYVEDFQNEHDVKPTSHSAPNYAAFRALMAAVAEAGSTETDAVRQELLGTSFPVQLWEGIDSRFRPCDQRSMMLPLTVTGRDPADVDPDEQNFLREVTDRGNLDDFYIPCDETGCDLPPAGG